MRKLDLGSKRQVDKSPRIRKEILVKGIVQGVGFRPFIYNLARSLRLKGYVLNSSEGVVIDVESQDAAMESFVRAIEENPPPLAKIEQISTRTLPTVGYDSFLIRESLPQEGKFVLVSPDIATCPKCLSELMDRADRRYGYPFTNCTNCGPRYTIIQDIPYDRAKTTMTKFMMCPPCQREYEDPSDRRFHAQPNACPQCGPSLRLLASSSTESIDSWPSDSRHPSVAPLQDVRSLLKLGKIVAIKGLGGFHLACDAENNSAVKRLRNRKRKSDKPFALMSREIASIERYCEVSETERKILEDPQKPIVLLRKLKVNRISKHVAPGNNYLGVMLPYTPLHYLLFGDFLTTLVMTSGNLSEEPIVTSNEDALETLSKIADYFLFHNRDIYMRVDDSVVRAYEERERVIRSSRGFAPHPIDMGRELPEILACGAELKNTFCLTKGRYAILSQHIGDLANYETLFFFEETLKNLKKLFRVEPKIVAYDLHPEYLSTKFALQQSGVKLVGVQHHHAHIAACMAENHLREKVIGIAFDGTGYGTDGQIWGGEFLVADFGGFERRGQFRYLPLPGGDSAIREPYRMAVSYLYDTFGPEFRDLGIELLERISGKRIEIIVKMIERRINTVLTSSCGRLFDAVSSLIGVMDEINYEAQAAIELEMVADSAVDELYPYEILNTDLLVIDCRTMIKGIIDDLRGKVGKGVISAKFHNALASMILDMCKKIRASVKIDKVCLSGGCFQNIYLLDKTLNGLRRNGFEVFIHEKVPPNDGGISLGQAIIANEKAHSILGSSEADA
ncbi:MAG: carbamoyltransferase HypF [Candidatus Binatia bacterium]